MIPNQPDDRTAPAARIVSAFVIPSLILAWLILYLHPVLSGERFAWDIQPPLTAAYMGVGYLGGAVLFIRALLGRRWHPVAAGFPAISAFTVAMLLPPGCMGTVSGSTTFHSS